MTSGQGGRSIVHNNSCFGIKAGKSLQVGVNRLLFCRRFDAKSLLHSFFNSLVILGSIEDMCCFHLFRLLLVALFQFSFRKSLLCLFLVPVVSILTHPLSLRLDAQPRPRPSVSPWKNQSAWFRDRCVVLVAPLKVVPRTFTWTVRKQKSSFYLTTNTIQCKLEAAGGPLAPWGSLCKRKKQDRQK